MNSKYEDAVKQLEQIVQQMETGELDIDQLSEQLKKAQQLIKLCREKLSKTEKEIEDILEKSE